MSARSSIGRMSLFQGEEEGSIPSRATVWPHRREEYGRRAETVARRANEKSAGLQAVSTIDHLFSFWRYPDMTTRFKRIRRGSIHRGRGVTAAYRPFKPGGGGSSPSGPTGA